MATASDRGLTKLTAKIFAPMYAGFDKQVNAALLRRDAFLDRMISVETAHLREDLQGLRLSAEGHSYISDSLKRLGGKKAPPLRQISIAVRHETADALRAIVEEHNIVRDAFLNRLIALLRSSDKLLKALDLPVRVRANRRDGTDDMPTSPLEAIQETQWDPFYYLRSASHERHDCGLYLLPFPGELIAMSCYLPDDEIPDTAAHIDRAMREKEETRLLLGLDSFEASLTTINSKPGA